MSENHVFAKGKIRAEYYLECFGCNMRIWEQRFTYKSMDEFWIMIREEHDWQEISCELANFYVCPECYKRFYNGDWSIKND